MLFLTHKYIPEIIKIFEIRDFSSLIVIGPGETK